MTASAATAALLLAMPATAYAAGDPVASGSVTLAPSGGFSKQLQSSGLKLLSRQLTIKGGSIDPTDGSGKVTLNGKLAFKKGHRKLGLKKVSAILGRGGALKVSGAKILSLRGGSVDRQGFGAQVNGVSAKLTGKGAKFLNRKLGLHSLHAGKAGTVGVSEQPQTVGVKGGQAQVTPSIGQGSVAFKLFAHCVNPILGVSALPPATQDSNLNFIFPATGGTIGPDGKDGLTLTAGGSQVSKDPTNNLGPCASVPSGTNIQQTDLQFDLNTTHVFGNAVINGYGPPLGGPKGVAIAMNIDRSHETVDSHANAKKVTIGNLVLTLSQGSVTFLNLVFPNQLGDPSQDFSTNDVFGTATLTLNTR